MTGPVPAADGSAAASARRASRVLSLLLLTAVLGTVQPVSAGDDAPPAFLLANVYRANLDLTDWWISEKYDGVRGYWDGARLFTRGGVRIAAPAWFTAGWPSEPMDGELWAGRGRFEHASATVRRQAPDDNEWRKMRFMVFDLPAHRGTFTQRLAALQALVAPPVADHMQAVVQRRVKTDAELHALLRQTIAAGGEGLMLHRGASFYRAGRSDDLLKLKDHLDAEARVLAVLPGRGKYDGMMGALLVEAVAADGSAGARFRLGSGFTDAQRRDPPAVGTLVTYRYRELNANGVPRFASFLRVRTDPAPAAAAR